MSFSLNAWLDNNSPQIQIMSNVTYTCVLQFSSQQTTELLNKQIIDVEDLYQYNPKTQQQLIKELFLFAACNDIACDGREKNKCQDCVHAKRLVDSSFQTMANSVSALLN